MADYLVQEEDGTSHIDLEESDGDLLLEEQAAFDPSRITQEPVEVVVSPTSGKGRVSQEPVEVVLRNLRETVSVVIWQ